MGKRSNGTVAFSGLRKGLWTPEEDKKLLSFILKHSIGSWSTLPQRAGLQRCGKSCMLRWKNYLDPNVKRGNFTLQEGQTIIQLHALLGNRWSAIAAQLPKRTDNEVKNYWNGHLKKMLERKGFDPVTHKHKSAILASSSNLSHIAQWEHVRLEAEARFAGQSNLEQLQPASICDMTHMNERAKQVLSFLKSVLYEDQVGQEIGSFGYEGFVNNRHQFMASGIGNTPFVGFTEVSEECDDNINNDDHGELLLEAMLMEQNYDTTAGFEVRDAHFCM